MTSPVGNIGGSTPVTTTTPAPARDAVKDLGNSEFLAQTAQFTTVEKMSEIAKSQAESLAVQLRLSASSMIGRTIAYPGPDGTELTGVVTATTFSGSTPTLKVGNTDVPLSSVREVRHTAAPSAPSNQ